MKSFWISFFSAVRHTNVKYPTPQQPVRPQITGTNIAYFWPLFASSGPQKVLPNDAWKNVKYDFALLNCIAFSEETIPNTSYWLHEETLACSDVVNPLVDENRYCFLVALRINEA